MARNARSILIAVVLWVGILGAAASIVRYVILPNQEAKERKSLLGKTGAEGRYDHKLRLAADSFSGYFVFRSKAFQDRLAKESIQLTVEDDGADYRARMQALKRGELQLAVFPLNSFLQVGHELGEFPATIIYLIDETVGADAIVAPKRSVAEIAALNDAKARIVATPDSPSEFLSRVLLASFQLPELSEQNWMKSADGAEQVYRKLRGDSGKSPTAYALWEPYVAKALQDDDIHVLLDSSKLKGFIVDALVVERSFLVDQYDVVKEVVEAYARTVYEKRDHLDEALREDASFLQESMSAEEAAQMSKGILWKNTLENYAHFGINGTNHSLDNIEDMLQKILDVLVKTEAMPPDALQDPIHSLYFTRILEEMKSEKFHPGRELSLIKDSSMMDVDESMRETRQLEALSAAQWNRLLPVGEMRVEAITFGRGTARLNISSRRELQALATLLASWPEYYLTVTGRVRPGGDEQAALALAEARARAAVDFLVDSGVAKERIRPQAEVAQENATTSQSVSFFVGQLPF